MSGDRITSVETSAREAGALARESLLGDDLVALRAACAASERHDVDGCTCTDAELLARGSDAPLAPPGGVARDPGGASRPPGSSPPAGGYRSFDALVALVRTLPPHQATAGTAALMVVALIGAVRHGRRIDGLMAVHALSAAGFTQAELVEHGADARAIAESLLAREAP